MQPAIRTPALEGWFRSRCYFEQLLVPDAIRRPGHSVKAFRINRPSVDEALPIRSALDPLQRISHLLQNCCVEFGFREVLAFGLVGHARISRIGCGVDQLLASRFQVTCLATRKACFHFDEPLFVQTNIHLKTTILI